MKKIFILSILLNLTLKSHNVVTNLDLEKFMGRWYVIALIPNWIEEDGMNSYDDYSLNRDGTIDIKYHTMKNNKLKTIKQKGIIPNKNINSRWEIKFVKPWIPFFKAPYEVIILDENYDYMAVGYPDNTFGWIMSRDTKMSNELYNELLNRLEKKFGYSKTSFEKVIHDKN